MYLNLLKMMVMTMTMMMLLLMVMRRVMRRMMMMMTTMMIISQKQVKQMINFNWFLHIHAYTCTFIINFKRINSQVFHLPANAVQQFLYEPKPLLFKYWLFMIENPSQKMMESDNLGRNSLLSFHFP